MSMGIFKKRESLVQNIAFLAIMSAVNIVLLLLSQLLPYLLILLTLILPFVSLLVTIYCKKRYYPIYILATIGLSFLVSFDAISNILFYILPGLLSGFIFGYCLEKEIPSNYSILYSAFVFVICSYACLLVCDYLFDQKLEEIYFIILNLERFTWRGFLIAPFIFAIGIIQSSLSYLTIAKEIKKLGITDKSKDDSFGLIYTFVFILLSMLSALIKPEAHLMFVGFTIYEFLHLEKNVFFSSIKLFVVTISTFVFVSLFSFALLFSKVPSYESLIILLIPMFICGIIVLVNNCFLKPNK